MPTCLSTLALGLIIIVLGGGFGFKFGGVKVGSISGGLGAVITVMSLFNLGC